jgi:heterodisulfide reductase subunit A-like polyferredoxin
MCQAPKDIPDTVAQASAVAAGVLGSLTNEKGIGSMSSLSLSEIEEKAKSVHSL